MSEIGRRVFLGSLGAVTGSGAVSAGLAGEDRPATSAESLTILGISCSPRLGKTTAAGLEVCLEAASNAVPGMRTELIELAGMNLPVFDPVTKNQGDFEALMPRLADPKVAGWVIGSPVYFSQMSSLCKVFLDHCGVFRSRGFALRNIVAGVLAVGGVRNGGQELTIAGVQAALLCQAMVVVGDGAPTAHTGATLVNTNDEIASDAFGLSTARTLGAHVARVAAAMAAANNG